MLDRGDFWYASEYLVQLGNLAVEMKQRQPLKFYQKGPGEGRGCGLEIMLEDSMRSMARVLTPKIPFFGEERKGELGKNRWYADPCDGTSFLENGSPLWGMAQVIPELAAIVVHPELPFAIRAMEGEPIEVFNYPRGPWVRFTRPQRPTASVIWDDRGPHTPAIYAEELGKILSAYKDSSSERRPAVNAVMRTLLNQLRGGHSPTQHPHDMACTYLLQREEIGGVAVCRNGNPIPYDQYNLPEVVIAASVADADRILDALAH